MNITSRYRVSLSLVIGLILMMVISLLSIYSSSSILSADVLLKQVFWFFIGISLILLIMSQGIEYFYRHANVLYIINVILLFLVLFVGKEVNGAKAWFEIPLIGSFQPSEFMKISLLLLLAVKINEFNERSLGLDSSDEVKFIFKCFVLTLLPSILTFFEPDTGAIIFYFIILLSMLFVSGINIRWFLLGAASIAGLAILFVLIYFINSDLFITLFGTSSFYRIDRLINFTSGDAYQLNNALTSMGSGGFWGHGINQLPLYFPEANTDFIFAVWVSSTGFIGGLLLILIFIWYDLKILSMINNTNNINKYIIGGVMGFIVTSQIINIGMTIGLLPIIGITLPYISYGGSSIVTIFIMTGLIFTINNEQIRFTN